jgi:hypothetical protein
MSILGPGRVRAVREPVGKWGERGVSSSSIVYVDRNRYDSETRRDECGGMYMRCDARAGNQRETNKIRETRKKAEYEGYGSRTRVAVDVDVE